MTRNPVTVRNFLLGWESLLGSAVGDSRIISRFLLEQNQWRTMDNKVYKLRLYSYSSWCGTGPHSWHSWGPQRSCLRLTSGVSKTAEYSTQGTVRNPYDTWDNHIYCIRGLTQRVPKGGSDGEPARYRPSSRPWMKMLNNSNSVLTLTKRPLNHLLVKIQNINHYLFNSASFLPTLYSHLSMHLQADKKHAMEDHTENLLK